MKRLICYLVLLGGLSLAGGRNSVLAETASSQTEITITLQQAPAVVPTPNQIITPSPDIRGTPEQGWLPRTNDKATPIGFTLLGMLCLLLTVAYLISNKTRRKKN